MAKIKQSTKHVNSHLVLEDPRPSSSALYILGDAHDFNSLSPIFAKSISTKISGHQGSHLGAHQTSFPTSASGAAGYPQCALMLTKGSTAVHQTTANGNDRFVNLDLQWAASLDPQYTPTGSSLLSNNITSGILFYNHINTGVCVGANITYIGLSSQQELYDAVPSNQYDGSFRLDSASGVDALTSIIPYVDPTSSRIPVIARNEPNRADYSAATITFSPGYLGPWPTLSTQLTRSSLLLSGWWGQFIGISSTGTIIYLVGNAGNDNQQNIVSYNINNNSTAYYNQFSAIRAAFGGAAGGTRNTATGIRTQIKLASTLFQDPMDPAFQSFYYPYFDVNNNFQPYYFQWNPVTDQFVRNENVAVVADTVSNNFYATSGSLNDLTAGAGVYSNWAAAVFCETFTFTQGQTTTRYLTLGAINGRYAVHDDVGIKRTFITFRIDSTDPKKLIYHSQFTTASTPRNIVWLNDSKTLLGVFLFNSFKIYNFIPAEGWVEAQTINQQFWAVGRDRIDRIWGAANASNSNFTDLHLITPALPVTIRIVPENTTYNYQGVTINTFVQVEAINVQGNRIEADITLVIDGPTFAFADDSKSQVVRTSASGSISVPIKITDSGFSQIIASVTI